MKKISIHFGINEYDKKYYGKTSNLNGCVNDASAMDHFCKLNKFATINVLNLDCTKERLVKELSNAASTLNAGDIFCFSQSSHGTFTTKEGKRITGSCMYDQIVWDYEFKKLLAKFKKGVLVILFYDACFSEDNFKFIEKPEGEIKYFDSKSLLKSPNANVRYEKSPDILCNLISYSSSNQFQPSYDLGDNGLFTKCMLNIFETHKNDNYYKFYIALQREIANSGYPQTPIFSVLNGDKERTTFNKFLN